VLLVAACASTPPAPVIDRSGARAPMRQQPADSQLDARSRAGIHRVRRGDTLYSIAFRNGLDYRELARANRIGPPYTIYVGQEIRIDLRASARAPAVHPAPVKTAPATAAAPQPRTPTPAPSTPSRSQADAARAPGTTQVPAASTPASQVPTPPVSTLPGPAAAPPAAAPIASSGGMNWQWPAQGQRISGFVAGDQTRQGVDIAGKSGDPVRAAADGEVVYSGNGLIGYGELIIIKHSPSLLSAYGHNRRRLVQEGDRVKGGQQIAEMGSSSASRDMLHFEIRRDGKPVDPLAFLPRR